MRSQLPVKKHIILLLLIYMSTLTIAQTWQVVTPKYGAKETVVAGFIADAAQYGNGNTDATNYIQNCLNQLDNAVNDANHGGGVLFLPEGKYKVSGTILIPKGITIRGDWQKPVKGQSIVGTILMAYNGKGSTTGTPFITMQPGAAVIDLAIWYPDQDPNNISPYPHTIQFGQPNYFGNEFCNVKNVTLVNSYSGIFFYNGGGTCPTISNVYGTPLKQGVEIDRIVDIGRTEWIDFSPAYWAGSGLQGAPALTNTTYTNWIYNNGTGIVMRRNDWSYTNYVTIDGYNKGFYATVSANASDPATPNGHNYGFTFNNCKYGLYFDGSNPVGIMFTEITANNCQYGAYAAPNTAGVVQLYKWNINATMCALFTDKTSSTKIAMQECTVTSGKVELQGGVLIASDNDFNNAQPQVQFEYNSRGNLTGNRFKNPIHISEKSVFLNQIDNTPSIITKLPPYYQFISQSKKPARNVLYNVTSYGVTIGTRNAIPAADATTGIQNALNKAKADGGGVVFLPPGHYRINGSLTIPTGVELKGSVDVGEFPMGPGSVLEVYASEGNENGAPCIQMQQGSGLRGLVFNYPNQAICTVLPTSVLKYPYSVQVQGSDVYIINVGFRAAYRGVDLFTYKCDRFYLDYLTGHVFNAGAKVDNGSSDGVIANMQFNPIVYNNGDESKFGGWPNSNRPSCSSDGSKDPYKYVAQYLDFLTIGNAPNILLYNDFNYGANHGLILKDGASGTAIGLGLDGDRTGVLVDGNANFNFTNTQDVALNFDALGGEQSSYIKTTANYTNGTINLFSSDYWGQATSSGIVMNGAGTINLNSANFESPGSQSFANVNNGTLNINNSVINSVNPLVNGTKVSGVNITGSQVSPGSLNTSILGSFKDNFSTAKPNPTTSLNRTGWIASASRSNSGRDPKFSIDGDATSSWSSGWQNDGVAVWFQIDMLSPQTFNEVILDYSSAPSDGPASYNFSVSNDGTNWTPLTTGSSQDQMTIISFPTTTVRYIKIDKPGSASKPNFWAINEFYVFNVTAPVDQSPYNGTAFVIPGTIEVEQYDLGGEGIAYHDATASNEGDANFRTTEGVDIGAISIGGNYIGWTANGEWTEYTVNVANTGSYDIQYTVASASTGNFHLEMDNVDITGTLSVATTGWQTWQTLKKQNVQLTQGVHILKFATNGGMNMDKLIFTNAILPPIISSAVTATGTVGTAFTYTITASNTPTSFEATGLPSGLSLNTASGAITGTPNNAGTYNVTVSATNEGGIGSKAISFTISVPTPTPYGGTAWVIPGTIEVENFDDGGEGIAYHDVDALNQGAQQRTNQGVDVQTTGDATGTYNVGWTSAGEWLKYSVNVITSGAYTLQARVASPNAGKSFHIEIDGTTIGTIAVPTTGGWQTYQTVKVTTPTLSEGNHTMRLYMDSDGFNINYITFAPTSTPYGGSAWAIPGTIQAENYDDGGEGLAYHDIEALNQGGQQRTNQGVDIETTGDVTGVQNVGWTSAGEWMKYTVNVTTSGTYTMQARVASPNSGKSFHVEMDGVTIGTFAVPSTGGWQTYQTVNVITSNITAGNHVMRIYMDTDGFNLNYVTFTSGAASTMVTKFEDSDLTAMPENKILLYPNPVTNGQLTVVVPSYWEETVSIIIWNNEGEVVYQTDSTIDANLCMADVSSLNAGFYLMQINNGNKSVTQPFMIK